MDTSELTPHFFNFSYFIPLILLPITMRALRFHGSPGGLIVRISLSLACGRKSGDVAGNVMSVLLYCNEENRC